MKIQLNKRALVNIHNEMQGWIKSGSVLEITNRTFIKHFQQHNGHKVEAAQKEMNDLDGKFFQYENVDGVPTLIYEMQVVKEGEPEKRAPKLIEGKTWDDFRAEKKALFETVVEINVL